MRFLKDQPSHEKKIHTRIHQNRKNNDKKKTVDER
jgi:hypothetical protein